MNFDKAIWPLQIGAFFKKLGPLSSAVRKILAFVSHFSVNFEPVLDCLIPNFKLKYDDSENINGDCANVVIFNLGQIKRWAMFLGHPVEVIGFYH